jgi:hypothetical protein
MYIRIQYSQSQRVRVTLQLTVSQSGSLGVEPNMGLLTKDLFFFKVSVLSFGGALSDERSGLSFVSLQSVYSSLLSHPILAYFPFIQHGPYRKQCLQQFFIASGTSLPICYLATVKVTETDP